MLFIVAGGSTYATAKSQDAGLASFIRNLLASCGVVVGVPVRHFHRKQRAVDLERALRRGKLRLLQCTALTALGTLVVVDDSFKKLSSVGGGLGADPVRLGRHGFRAKVAID